MSRIAVFAAIAATLIAASQPGHAALINYHTTLSGAAEFPPNASPGTGFATFGYDTLAHTLAISVDWSGLIGTTTVAHIHCCTAVPHDLTAGVAVTPGTLPGFPVGLTAGSYDVVINLADIASYTAGFRNTFGGGTVAGAEAALIAGFDSGRAYLNLHTTVVPAGEIRGFIVPERGMLALAALGIAGVAVARTRRN